MKRVCCGLITGMMIGAGVTGYFMTNKKTKKEANRLMNTMIKEADQKLKSL